ncbi:Rieske (2Fe-2S) protein [Streptomyces sp. NPDC019396]|uniref:Rieske (2Fe-2S) protein n=1 Tax=Streptomyces sp. NPDC019396 TaxID=3154687 RepID=UPI00340E7EA2
MTERRSDPPGDGVRGQGSSRRTVLASGAAVLVAAGCTRYGEDTGGGESFAPEPGSPTAAQPGGERLGTTAEVPEGGGKVFTAQKVVVTQPEKGDFKAFTAVCTHQGCLVDKVANGTIDCPCHGSEFRVTDGSVARGPATRPLAAKPIAVSKGEIRLA